MDITEDVVELVARKIWGGAGPSGTDSEYLHGWLLKFRDDIKKLHISVETLVEWLTNQIPPWAAYREFISERLIALDKELGVYPMGIRETCRQLFSTCLLKVTVPESTHTCKYDQLYEGFRTGIDKALQGVQSIWEANSTNENCGFLLIDAKNLMLWTFHNSCLYGSPFFKLLLSLVIVCPSKQGWCGQYPT